MRKPMLAKLELCTGCSACYAACPKDAIQMLSDNEGFLRPDVDERACVGCLKCERACPILHPRERTTPIGCFAAYSKDLSLRTASSSGGIFGELAKKILDKGGRVFGCIWDEEMRAIHIGTSSYDDIVRMRGSKYVQSDVRKTFREVRACLELGQWVLYTGTPCQIAGLRGYLAAYDQHQLLAVEVICHGAPSPAVFAQHIRELEQEANSKVVDYSFRMKKPDWRHIHQSVSFLDSTKNKSIPLYSEAYCHSFENELSVRPSCKDCRAKTGKSGADLTIADFWKIEAVCPSMNDDMGVSAIIAHSELGRQFVDLLSGTCALKEVKLGDIISGNPSYEVSYAQPAARAVFMMTFRDKGLRRAFDDAMFGAWYVRIFKKIRRFL